MPELPEVETIKNDLRNLIIGKKIIRVKSLWPKMIQGMTTEELEEKVKNREIVDIRRRAKNLIIELEPRGNLPKHLLLHMKMTGHLIITDEKNEIDSLGNWKSGPEELLKDVQNRFVRFIFYLSEGKIMAFSDLRKFGYIKLVDDETLEKFLAEYGPEPLEKDFTFEVFKERLGRKKGPIKKVLMDQATIAGIGNIYADEILFEAKIHPLKKVEDLREGELKKIFDAIKKILALALEKRGTSISDYRDASGQRGSYDLIRNVYRRTGLPCYDCGGKVERISVGGRGTHFCPACQRQ
ncbi:MAG: DNA-formamidopyrimidine glycosylase [Patescibacteria group bacterium]|nr:DNA-formamidopyrimidine glycosylase [Patescibacteria group bacterium]MCL5093683.1 DNA-formamidopyrimidine glycosylase [Patescibacteria group bacterium]